MNRLSAHKELVLYLQRALPALAGATLGCSSANPQAKVWNETVYGEQSGISRYPITDYSILQEVRPLQTYGGGTLRNWPSHLAGGPPFERCYADSVYFDSESSSLLKNLDLCPPLVI